MSNLKWCPECGTHHWNNETCFPDFYVTCPEHYGDDEASRIRAKSPALAAEKFLEMINENGDYAYVDETVSVSVIGPGRDGDGEVYHFRVCCEAVLEYTADQTEGPE